MVISRLIKELEKIQEENGDLPVTAYVDHGQTDSLVRGVAAEYVEDLDEELTEKLCSAGLPLNKVVSIYAE